MGYPRLVPSAAAGIAATLLLLAAGEWLQPARAQLSPNCQRNGRKDYCAITPIAGATTERQAFDMVTFADHTVYEVLRNETSCRQISEAVRTCDAKIITPPGNPQAIPAYYRGTRYEGGYRHEYVGRGVHIVYVFLD